MNGKEALALDRQTVGTLLQASMIHLFLVWCQLVFTQDGATQENKKNQEVSSKEKNPWSPLHCDDIMSICPMDRGRISLARSFRRLVWIYSTSHILVVGTH